MKKFNFKIDKSKNPVLTFFLGIVCFVIFVLSALAISVAYCLASFVNFIANFCGFKKPFYTKNQMNGNEYNFELNLNKKK